MPRFALSSAVVAMGLLIGSAQAAYVLTPLSGGLSEKTVQQGGSFTLDLVLTSNASDDHTSAVFTVEFDKAGLNYNSHAWGSPYTTDGIYDASVPNNAATSGGLTLAKSSYVAGFADPDAVDVYFDNFTPTAYTTGTLLSLSITVPNAFALGDVFITAVPDTFDDGFGSIATTGQTFKLTVTAVPEPGAVGLMLASLLPLLARRQGRRH